MNLDNEEKLPFLTRVVDIFLRGDVAILLVLFSMVLGTVALILTPREEEPQIVVPLADILVQAPGLSALEVEQQVTSSLEQLLYQIDGVEYVYSVSRPGECVVTVRYYVGEDREDSIVKLYNKVDSNIDMLPPTVANWVVKPIEIDDVPIVILTLWAEDTERYNDYHLRRIAGQFRQEFQALRNTGRVDIVGGRPRRVRIELDPVALASRGATPLDVQKAIFAGNVNVVSGSFEQRNTEIIVEAGAFFSDAKELENLVIQVNENRPVYLKDIATVIDGPAESKSYGWIGFGPADTSVNEAQKQHVYPAVQLAISKQKGSNAVHVAEEVLKRIETLAPSHLPEGIHYRVTRNYGKTADAKVDELLESLVVAVLTVVGLIGVVLGWRPALVIALTIPVCYSLTLFFNLLLGYTINRVTMFALILSLGLLVDDPITDVENIARYFSMKIFGARKSVLVAINEVRPALILSTLAIIISFLPLFFITGMMGPYMAPMALNVPLTVTMSTFVAFFITPWASMVALRKLLKGKEGEEHEAYDLKKTFLYRGCRAAILPILNRNWLGWLVLAGCALLLVSAMAVPLFRVVPLKMLPYDNKNEFQIIVDMPEGTTLERTDAVARELGRLLSGVPEVTDYEVTVGESSPMDFNGMVRHYFLRKGSYVADIRINLVDKDFRVQQSHEILLRLRKDMNELAQSLGANIKLVEVPPGPPVIATVTAEVYGPETGSYGELMKVANSVEARLEREPGIVDVDTSSEEDQVRWQFVTDKAKAALSGVSTQQIAQTLQIALDGKNVSVLHNPEEVEPLYIELQFPREVRSAIDDLKDLHVHGSNQQMVPLESVGKFVKKSGEKLTQDKAIYHKNLKRVVFVYGEVAGRPPAEAIIDIQLDRVEAGQTLPKPVDKPVGSRTWLNPGGGDPWQIPAAYNIVWAGEGEWKITLDVFRDLGLAFGAAQIGIFILLMFQTQSRVLPLVIMLAIPLTMIGIMPGFWLLNVLVNVPINGYQNPVFFTATAMIGMIALSGIVVRNSVVLIDFIHQGIKEGMDLKEAIVQSVAVRTRPILLTAGTTLLGNWVITLDPIFSGLAWAIIFGILMSTVFTVVVIPLVYWLLYQKKHAHSDRSQNL